MAFFIDFFFLSVPLEKCFALLCSGEVYLPYLPYYFALGRFTYSGERRVRIFSDECEFSLGKNALGKNALGKNALGKNA